MHDSDDAHDCTRAAAQLPPFLQMMQMIAGFQVSQALQAAAELDLATILVDGPCTVEDLSAFTGARPESIDRIVGFLENLGVFRRTAAGVEVTGPGRALAHEGAHSARAMARDWMRSYRQPLADLVSAQSRGGYVPAGGGAPFDWVGESMRALDQQGITARYEVTVSRPGDRTPEHDECRFAAAAGPPDGIDPSVVDALGIVQTDDAYVVSSVLNDWSDEDFARILKAIADGTAPGARLVLVELVLPDDRGTDRPAGRAGTDPLMLAMLGGRGHTAGEWESVLGAGGFALDRIVPGVEPFSFLEAVRR